MSLQGKVALVTGGGRGIGRAVAERLAQDGARVVVAGRTEPEIAAVSEAIGGIALRLDVGDRAEVAAALPRLRELVEHVDILVNNAGVAESAPFFETTDEAWDRMFAVNVTGAFALCKALVPAMMERGFGRVVNVASNAGLTGYAYSSGYCASKHAIVGMSRAMALEIARSPVTINCVCPGWVETQMSREAVARIQAKTGRSLEEARKALTSMSPQRRMVEPDEVAAVVAMLCTHEARSIHGQAIPVDGGQVMS
ncbi:SDR family NAD(P)-dependent oxidoreductase [Chondromyces apiculatus]|uniref:D-beta-hydroxybutyrate dehydrogenase n=1 Tax=Chondromyces apiculatus DSM 436 TaxID=1192034 RepID=A0A017SVJ4_9BACT|nr:SDR family NAD(P)-dependent oxidoreductase [Chondromyces apiculatus]EYF00331.1 D-beta-hydroxybutyrate dehydrogenase [Chondromyces apiculatus DSM 436]